MPFKSTSTSALDRAAIEAEGAFIDGRLKNIAFKHKQLRALFSKFRLTANGTDDVTLTFVSMRAFDRDLAGKRRRPARVGIRKLFIDIRIRDSACSDDHLGGDIRVAFGLG
jgi:hypothetical protein